MLNRENGEGVTDNQPSGISKFRIHRGRRRVRRDKRWRLRPLFLVCTPRNRLWVNAGALEAKDKRYSLFQIGGPLIFLPRRKNLWVTGTISNGAEKSTAGDDNARWQGRPVSFRSQLCAVGEDSSPRRPMSALGAFRPSDGPTCITGDKPTYGD